MSVASSEAPDLAVRRPVSPRHVTREFPWKLVTGRGVNKRLTWIWGRATMRRARHVTGRRDSAASGLGQRDEAAGDRLIPLVYQDLRRRAGAYFRRERPGHTLQPTALVHEAYLRLVDQRHVAWKNRAQFLALAAQMMRRILVDHARRGKMAKRSGRWRRVELESAALLGADADVHAVALHDLLNHLAEFDSRKSRVVELRYFGGLTLEETAHVLGVSAATVDREWRLARAWLRRQLTSES
jgi:RNA polymerase sigma-70 factor, ECF subfamily